MTVTREMLNELYGALVEMQTRCPVCHGTGRVRSAGDYRTGMCLLCEVTGVTEALKRRDGIDVQGLADLRNKKARDLLLTQVYPFMRSAAAEFIKRCPACYGVRQVYHMGERRPCIVCERLARAIDTYDENVEPSAKAPAETIVEPVWSKPA